MQEATQPQQPTSQPPEKAAAKGAPQGQRRRPPTRVTCDCCAPAAGDEEA